MRILFCSNVYPPYFIGGAELIAHFQAKAIQSLGHEVLVFAGDPVPFGGQPNGPRHSMRCEYHEGIKVYRVCLEGIDYQSEHVNFFHQKVEEHFSAVIRDFRPDIVHCHNIIGLSVGLINIARQYNARVVITVHDHWGFCLKNTLIKSGNAVCRDFSKCFECQPYFFDEQNRFPVSLRRNFIKSQFSKIDLLISPSKYLANTYIKSGFPPGKATVIANGIDARRFANVKKAPGHGKLRITYIGHIGEHKGTPILLDALKHLPPAIKNQVLINLVGVGEMADTYQAEVKNAGHDHLVRFWGKISNDRVEEVYEQTDVLVLPSIWPENQPVTITEAMICGIPVIGSDIGGIPELVEDGKTGYLVKPGDSKQIAEAIVRFFSDSTKIRQFGEASHGKMSHYSFDNQAKVIVNAYHNAISAAPFNERQAGDLFLVCAGNGVSAESETALQKLTESNLQFVMLDWINPEDLRRAKVIWVVNESVSLNQLRQACQYKLPLLVPEQHFQLKEICRRYNCGLYYNTPDEAVACIDYLLHNPDIANKIGTNACQWGDKAI